MITMCVYSLGTCILLIFFEKIPRPIREAALSVDVIGLMLGEPQVGCNIMRNRFY